MSKVILIKKQKTAFRSYRKSEDYMRIRLCVEDVQIIRNALSEVIRARYPDSEVEQRGVYTLGERRQGDVEDIFTKICEKLDMI